MDTKLIHLSDNFQEAINSSIDVLKSGGVIIFPTDTVYGIGCHWNSTSAINSIFELKQRDYSKPLSAYFANVAMVKEYVEEIPDLFYNIATEFLPGALTLILRKNDKISDLATSNFKTLGVRIPNNQFILKLVDKLGEPILGTSANLSNEGSMKSADDTYIIFKNKVPLIIEEDSDMIGIESTVIDLSLDMPKVLRQGAIDLDDFLKKHQIKQ